MLENIGFIIDRKILIITWINHNVIINPSIIIFTIHQLMKYASLNAFQLTFVFYQSILLIELLNQIVTLFLMSKMSKDLNMTVIEINIG